MSVRQSSNPVRYFVGSMAYMFFSNVFTLGQSRRLYKKLGDTLRLEPNGVIVELGCGPGVVTEYLKKNINHNGKIIGVDFAPTMIERALKRKEALGWSNVEYRCGDARTFSHSTEVDAVVFSLSLTAMPDYQVVLANALKALRPGGQLIILDSIPYPSRTLVDLLANSYIQLKSYFVGARPEVGIADFCKNNLDQYKTVKNLGGVYTLITGYRKALCV